jgi:TatA/E family protein of Tat protein translocase
MGPGEILLALTVALLLFGAKRLPSIARSLGQALAEFKRSAQNLKQDLLQEPAEPPSRPLPDRKPPAHEAMPQDPAARPPEDPQSPYFNSPDTDLRG